MYRVCGTRSTTTKTSWIPNLHKNPHVASGRWREQISHPCHTGKGYIFHALKLRVTPWRNMGGRGVEIKGPRTLHLTLDKNWMIIFGPQTFYPRIKWPQHPTWMGRGEHRISEIIKSLITDSFEPHHSRCGWEASVVSRSLFISLCVTIHTLRWTNSNVFDYGVLFQTPVTTLRYIWNTCTVITFLKSEKFCIPKHTWP
jgi:hypothetical protein